MENMRASFFCSLAQKGIERAARVDCEWLGELHVKALACGRVHLQLVNSSSDGFQKMRPRLQSFRCNSATACLRLALWSSIEQCYAHLCARQPFSRERTRRACANNQNIEGVTHNR